MTVQPAHTLVSASAAHAALRAAGKHIAELGPRLTTALQALDRSADTFVRAEDKTALAAHRAIASGVIDGTLAKAAAVVAFGEKYYGHVALHGGAAAFIAHVEETLPGLAQIAGELEQTLGSLELQQTTTHVVSAIRDVVVASDQIVAALGASRASSERTVDHLHQRLEGGEHDPAAARKLAQATDRAAADLRDFAATIVADYQRGRAPSPDPAVEGANGLKTPAPAKSTPATHVTPSRGEHGSDHGAY